LSVGPVGCRAPLNAEFQIVVEPGWCRVFADREAICVSHLMDSGDVNG